MKLAESSGLIEDSEPNIFLAGDGSPNESCHCSNTWVLVIHNDFLQVEGYERKGNEVDVANLKRVWQRDRQCKLAELKNCTREQIISTISNDEKMSQLFHPRNSYAVPCEPPDLFLLFVLSHGESGGKILTNHLKPKLAEQKHFVLTLETYGTCDVWKSLMNVQLLSSCMKILFFAPCRGKNPELQYGLTNKNLEDAAGGSSSGFLTSEPNREDFIIFYATVETTFSNRDELQGTWFVQSICSVLDAISENEDILLFFTKVQNHMCQRTNIDCLQSYVGQTPQLHFLANKQIDLCASHTTHPEKAHSRNKFGECVTSTDCMPSEMGDLVCSHATDAKRSNITSTLIEVDRALFYNWGQEHFRFHRGKALIFHDDPHIYQAYSIGECFKDLDYDVKIFSTNNIMTEIARKSLKKKFKYDGSLILCVLAQLKETDSGLSLMGEKCIPLSEIVDELSGHKCKNLIGKPKLLFFIDEGTKQDHSGLTAEAKDVFQFSNTHAGICLFTSSRTCPDESLTDHLISLLALDELKSGKLGLQCALVDLIRTMSANDFARDKKCIKSQLISTLPVFVDFPPLLKPYKPFLTIKERILVAAGFMVAMFSLALVLSLTIFGDTANVFIPKNYPNVYMKENCTIGFSMTNSSYVDAFSLDESTWTTLSEKCKEKWKATHMEEFKTVTLNDAGDIVSALQNVKESAPFEKRHIKLVTLFGYNNAVDLQYTLKFLNGMTSGSSKGLLVQSCIDIFHRMESFEQLQQTMVLPFWEIILKAGLDTELNFTLPLNHSQSAVITNICRFFSNIQTYQEYHKYSIEFSGLDNDTKMFFLPTLISTCSRSGSFVKYFFEYIQSMQNIACIGFNEIFVILESESKLGTIEAFTLQTTAESVTQDAELCKIVVENLQQYPYSAFRMFLKLFDDKSYDIDELHARVFNFSEEILPRLVLARYNGSAKNGVRLAKLLWNSADSKHRAIICNSTHELTQQMKLYHKLYSFHALVLFTYVQEEMVLSYTGLPRICLNAIDRYAPDIVKAFLFADCGYNYFYFCKSCDMETDSCIENAINEIDDIMKEHGTSDDANVTYPHQVMFLGYVLHSLELKAANMSNNYNKVISTQKIFNETYEWLYDEMMNKYFYQNHTTSNSVELLWFNENFYDYFSNQMFRRGFAQFGLTIMGPMIVRLDRLVSTPMVTGDIYCNCAATVYTELAKNKSLISSEEAFSVFLYLEQYLHEGMYDEPFILSSDAQTKCTATLENMTEGVQAQQDYFLRTWNNLTLRPMQLQWHKNFQLSSPWFLPKLVQHVVKYQRPNLLKLVEFFQVLQKHEVYSDPLCLCPGLYELSKHLKSYNKSIRQKIREMFPNDERIQDDSKNYKGCVKICTFFLSI